MWFKALSLLIGVPCLLKGVIGLALPVSFYRWRQGQYASARPPGMLLVALIALAVAVTVTWYATLFHYVRWGWLVTAFINMAAVLSAMNLTRWQQHRERALHAVDSAATRRGVDLALVGIGIVFMALAIAVYR